MVRNLVPKWGCVRATLYLRRNVTHLLLGTLLLKVWFSDSWEAWDPFVVYDYEDYFHNNTKRLSAFCHCLIFVLNWGTKAMWVKLLASMHESGQWHQTLSGSHGVLHCQVLAAQRKAPVSLQNVPWEAVKMTTFIKYSTFSCVTKCSVPRGSPSL